MAYLTKFDDLPPLASAVENLSHYHQGGAQDAQHVAEGMATRWGRHDLIADIHGRQEECHQQAQI